METKQEGGHYLKIKYDWLQCEDGQTVTFPFFETGFLKDWHLMQIEGQEPVPAEPEVVDPKAKGKAPAKKPDPKKGAALEEITDNRPRTVSYEKDFGADGAVGI